MSQGFIWRDGRIASCICCACLSVLLAFGGCAPSPPENAQDATALLVAKMGLSNGEVELQGANQEDKYRCKLIRAFACNNEDYALLKALTGPRKDQLVVMRVTESGGSVELKVVEDDDEFRRVVKFVQSHPELLAPNGRKP